jgi:hypothetical protein
MVGFEGEEVHNRRLALSNPKVLQPRVRVNEEILEIL